MYDPKLNEPFLIITSIPGVPLLEQAADICRFTKGPAGKKKIETASISEETRNICYRYLLDYEKEQSSIPFDGIVRNNIKINEPYPCPDELAAMAVWPKSKSPDFGCLFLGIILIVGTGVIIVYGIMDIVKHRFTSTVITDPNSKPFIGITLFLFFLGVVSLYRFYQTVKQYN